MNIFKKKYTLRKFSEQKTVKGFAVKASYTDQIVLLNVQPMVAKEMETLPQGDRVSKGIKSYGDFKVQTADVERGLRADRLFYAGEWYECVSSSFFEHTPLSHWKSLYVRASEADWSDGVPTGEVKQ
jgi:hypothetical protein